MKKLLCAFVLVLITMSPTLVFADDKHEFERIKIFSVQLINGVRTALISSRADQVASLQKKIYRITLEYPHAKVTTMQSSGDFFTQITVVVQY